MLQNLYQTLSKLYRTLFLTPNPSIVHRFERLDALFVTSWLKHPHLLHIARWNRWIKTQWNKTQTLHCLSVVKQTCCVRGSIASCACVCSSSSSYVRVFVCSCVRVRVSVLVRVFVFLLVCSCVCVRVRVRGSIASCSCSCVRVRVFVCSFVRVCQALKWVIQLCYVCVWSATRFCMRKWWNDAWLLFTKLKM